MSADHARAQLELSESRWREAVRGHAQPPPDTGFSRRLKALADAAAQEQAAYRYADEQGFRWRPGPPWLPPRELRPASWRPSVAPGEIWARLDEAIEGLSRARTGLSVAAISRAFGELFEAAWALAAAVDDQLPQARGAQRR